MSQSSEELEATIERIDSKAGDYETATNFEAKKQEYLNGLSSIEQSLQSLERQMERMEFLATVLTEVLEVQRRAPSEVNEARRTAERVIDHDADYFYKLVDNKDSDSYKQKVQQAQANAQKAIDSLEAKLREEKRKWKKRVAAARDVQKLFGDSRDMSTTFNEIDAFVERRMLDDSESTSSLQADWKGLKKNWEQGGADWDTFQKENGLSDRTIEELKDLSKGNDIRLSQLDEDIIIEMMSVQELKNVVKVTI